MAAKALPCPTLLRLLLDYDPETGKLYWKPRKPWMFKDGVQMSAEQLCYRYNKRYADREAFTSATGRGYKAGRVLGRPVCAHVVAWAMVSGVYAPNEVDHVNGDPADNRVVNLRAASRQENMRNTRPRRGASSRFKGVHLWRGPASRQSYWRATITLNGKTVPLGYFKSETEAAMAYNEAAAKHFGVFAKLNEI